MAFDPCREWLGIDAVDLADPCRVLGLEADTRDAPTIACAADARLEALGRVAPGPFAKAHAALIAKVEEARDSLLARAFSAAPIDRAAAAARWPTAPPEVRVGSSRWPEPPAPGEFEPEAEPADDELAADGRLDDSGWTTPVVGRSARRPRRASTGGGGLLLASLALLAAAAAMIVVLMLRTEQAGQKAGRPSTQMPPSKPGPAAVPQPQPPAVPPSVAVPPSADEPPSDRQPPPGDMADRELQERMEEEQARRAAELAAQQAAAAKAAEEARRLEAMQAAEAEQRAEQERLRMQESLEASLTDAFTALQRGEFDTADRSIAAAEKRVGDDVEAATRLERWRLLATYARDFAGHRDEAFAKANAAGSEYTVEGKTFAVIEITPDKFIYRLSGRTERVPRERAPQIEMAIVGGWFAADGRAANHLFLGTRWLCLDPPNLPRAKAEWRIAGEGGEQVEPLVALLDDPVVRRAARRTTP